MNAQNQQTARSIGLADTATSVAKGWAMRSILSWMAPVVGTVMAVIAGLVALFVVVMVLSHTLDQAAQGGTTSAVPGVDAAPSGVAKQLIPPQMLALYRSSVVSQQCPTMSWTITAAQGHLESNDGRNMAVSSAGAVGPAQFMPATWDNAGQLVVNVGRPYGEVPKGSGFGVDGDGDGLADIRNPWDAFPAAARMLCANGGGDPKTLPQALYLYNHASWYVYGGMTPDGSQFEGVLPLASRLAAGFSTAAQGPVIQAPGANLPGEPIKPETLSFLQTVAGIYGKPIVCSTGTNHSYYTVDGLVSDHATGHACDFGMVANGGSDDGPVGDAIATACLIAAGDTPAQAAAEAAQGGLYTKDNVPTVYGPMRVQCIWKTYEGGNHHNHVHIGARPE